MALWGEPGAMIDGCIHLPLMTLHAIIITDKHNTSYVLSVYKQQCGYMNRYLRNVPICHESWDIATVKQLQ